MGSTKRKVLIFSDWFLPGYRAGGPIVSCAGIVRNLHSDFDFFVVCSDRDYLESSPYPDVDIDRWNSRSFASILYLSPDKESYGRIVSVIREVEPDTIYVNGIFSKVYSIFSLIAAQRAGVPTIVAPRGMLAPGALSLKRNKKRLFLALIKFINGYKNVVFHATNEEEKQQIHRRLGSSAEVEVVQNIPSSALSDKPREPKRSGHLNILTVARIAPEKNIHFALECLRSMPDHIRITHRIIGPVYDQKYFQKCKTIAESFPDNVEVLFAGARTPEDIAEACRSADLFFLPTLGENFGHAIVEAMLAGLPVLISDKTPWQNLDERDLGHVINLSDREEFIRKIVTIAQWDENEYGRKYGDLDKRADQLMNLPDILKKYKRLFA